MLISHALLAPHRPTMLVDEHRGHRTEMLEALARASETLLAEIPEVLVVVSARWDSAEPFLVDVGKRHQTITDYTRLGVEVRYDCNGHPPLARALVEAGQKARVHVGPSTRGVDSGVSVPLHFLAPSRVLPVVPLSLARRSPEECRHWGQVIRETLEAWPARAAFVVGGTISCNQHAWNLNRVVPETAELDRQVLEALEHGAWDQLGAIDRRLRDAAQPEAELRHLELLRGFLLSDVPGEIQCYETGPGVGAALMAFTIGEPVTSQRELEPPAGGA